MLKSHNFLILDEPTNHMDIRSKDVLKQALKSYDGTLVVVSHDRDFLEGLVDKIYEFRQGRVKEHLGGVEGFLQRRKIENLQELERAAEVVVAEAPSKDKSDYEAGKEKARASRKIRDRISYLEREIEKLEKRMAGIESKLESPSDNDDIMELTREYLECKRDLDAKTEEWGSLI